MNTRYVGKPSIILFFKKSFFFYEQLDPFSMSANNTHHLLRSVAPSDNVL